MTKEEYLIQQDERKKEEKIKKKNRRPKKYTKEKLHKRNHECITHLNKVELIMDEKGGLDLNSIDLISLSEAKGYNTETLEKLILSAEHTILPTVGTYKIYIISSKGTKSELSCVVKKPRNKYKNKKVMIGNITFDSKKEAEHYRYLKEMQSNGQISGLELQKVFELIPKQSDERAVTYVADFYYKTSDGQEIVEDTKGWKTSDYIIKRKLFKYIYKDIIFTEL